MIDAPCYLLVTSNALCQREHNPEVISRIYINNSLHWRENVLGNFFPEQPRSQGLFPGLGKGPGNEVVPGSEQFSLSYALGKPAVSYEELIMSKDKYPSIFWPPKLGNILG